MSGRFDADDLQQLTGATIRHYDENARRFREGTWDHDVTQNYEAFLSALPDRKPLEILDLGCGPGRDVLHFTRLGHHCTGLDGSAAFCKMVEEVSGRAVLQQDFIALDLPEARFDGIFANASLFHVPRQELPRVLSELRATLKPGGVLFSSNPRGAGEAVQGLRYGNYMEFEEYGALLKQAGFEILDHYYRPQGRPREEQPWLAVVSRRVD